MPTHLFYTRNLGRVTRRANANAGRSGRNRAEGLARARRAKSVEIEALRWELSGLLSADPENTPSLAECAARLGISKSYAQKLFAITREELGVPVRD